VDSALLESVPNREWIQGAADGGAQTVFFLIPGLTKTSAWDFRDSLLRWMRVVSVVRQDNSNAKFIFLCDAETGEAVRQLASACNLLSWICVLPPEERGRVVAAADVVICDTAHVTGKFAIEALARGRALLAGDLEQHRDITSDGRGCLWFRSGDVGDIALRARFLAGNAQFRRALGAAGREHCVVTRSAEVVASQYDAVYRLAFGRRKDRGSPPRTQLIPLEVGG
jgi:glycosyltransferase involved in cell wall biosynthesis